MPVIDFWLPTRIIFGEDCVNRLDEFVPTFGTKRALILSDPVVAQNPGVARVAAILKAHGIESHLFTFVNPNPTVDNVNAALALAQETQPGLFIAVGGGSVIDTAKVTTLLLANGGAIQDYVGVERASQQGPPLIAIPTTAGTGSEVSRVAIISDVAGQKMVIIDSHLSPWMAIIDPAMTYSCPPRLTAIAGMDAITHAIESYTSRNAKFMTEPLSLAALHLLASSIHTAVTNGQDRTARRAMSAGSNMAAIAAGYAGLGICHSLANPLTRFLGLSHGHACAIVLPHVVSFNWVAQPSKFAEIAQVLGCAAHAESIEHQISEFVSNLGLPTRLGEVGLTREMIPEMLDDAMKNPANRSNPRDVNAADLEQILERSL